MMLDYRVIMVSDGNATLSDETHAASLNNFVVYFGDVMTTDDAVARLVAGGKAPVRLKISARSAQRRRITAGLELAVMRRR